jgi:hypothetical protein
MNATIVSDAALERPPVAGPMPSSVPDVVGSGVVASTGAFIALLQMLIGSKGSVIDAARDAPAKTNPVASQDGDEPANERAATPTSFVQISVYMPSPPRMGDATVGRNTPGGGEAGTTAADQRDRESPGIVARTGPSDATTSRAAPTAPAPDASAVFAAGGSVDRTRAARPNASELEASKGVLPEPGKAEPRIDVVIATARRAVSWTAAGHVDRAAEDAAIDSPRHTEARLAEGGHEVADAPSCTMVTTAPQAPHDELVSDGTPAPPPATSAVFVAAPLIDRARMTLPNATPPVLRTAEPVHELPRAPETRHAADMSLGPRTDGRHDVVPNAAESDASKRLMPEPGKPESRIDVAIASARRTVSWTSDGPVATAVESAPIDKPRSPAPRVVEGGQPVSDTPPRTIAVAAPQAPHDVLASDTASTERSTPRRTVAEQIVGQVANVRHEGRQSMSLRLDPPELGAVRIDAVLDGRHVSLEIRTEHAEARAMVEGSLPAIRQALEDRGFVADQLSVQLGMDTATGSAGHDAERFAHPASPPPPEPKRMIAPRRRVARAPVEGLDLLV